MPTKYDLSFLEELKRLNEGQRAAVEQLEGPVLVIAGPGTGKTQILSARIGKILSSPEIQASPHNILCLTYTDAGTIAMRKRLLKFVGPDAYRVHIFTFHAFCNQVIQENMDYFSSRYKQTGAGDLQPISDLETIKLYKKLIDGIKSDNPLKRYTGNAYYESGRLKNLFNLMKQENFSTEDIIQKSDQYLANLPEREEYRYKKAVKGYKKGDLNEKKFNEEKDKIELLKAAALLFPEFEKLMRAERRYDFNDMIRWVLDAFKNNENVLLNYQERYHYFLVDEYQDTSGSQNELLRLLTGYWDVPNVFVVGDDDQSIYKFQGANVKNIKNFERRHEAHIARIVLTENYRSTQAILDTARAVIDNNKNRLAGKKPLVAQGPEVLSSTVKPELIQYYNTLHEEAAIVKEIEKLYEAGTDLSEVAVIYRNHKLVENIVSALEKKRIPLNLKKKIDILDLPFVNSLIQILKYIQLEFDRPHSSENILYEIMHYHFFNIDPRDIAAICIACRYREGAGKTTWREFLADKQKMSGLNLVSGPAISALEANLNYWISELKNLTVQGLFEKIITRGNVLSYVMNSSEKIWLMQVLSAFFDFIKDETAKKENMSLSELLAMIEDMKSNKVSIPLNKILHAENGVNFITAHSSKGLEFKYVFLISCTSGCWESQGGNKNSYNLPDNLFDLDHESEEEGNEEEERRLFYVAMTRAKEHLFISYPVKDKKEKALEMSRFVAEIIDGTELKQKEISMDDETVLNFQAAIMMGNNNAEIDFQEKEFIKDAIKNYRLSVTDLNKYLSCPLTFYFEKVVRVPSARNENMGFGNAIHFALEKLFLRMKESEAKEFPSKEELTDFFRQGLEKFHSHFTNEEKKRRLEYGEKLLPEYYDHYVDRWNKVVSLEYRINHVEVDGVPLSGVLDKVEFDGNKINVVDYKTGNPDNKKKDLNPPDEKNPLGGDYWRQIVFYKILVESDRTKNYEMLSGEIDFVEKSRKNEFLKSKVYVRPEDITLVKKQIKESYEKIMNLEFNRGCQKDDCTWCNFVKYHYRSDKLDLTVAEE